VSRAPVLLMLDADILLQSDLLEEALSHLHSNAFVTLQMITESERNYLPAPAASADSQSDVVLKELVKVDEMEFVWKDETTTAVTIHRGRMMQGAKSGSGILVARKGHLLGINGYNSELRFWGWEDIDVLLRLQRLGLRRVECGSAIHLTHDDSRRAVKGETRGNTNVDNFLLVWSRYARGNFSGTYTDDVAKWADLVVPAHVQCTA
jgi:predicted glycosyltransferase involved in capsule biosynthesis